MSFVEVLDVQKLYTSNDSTFEALSETNLNIEEGQFVSVLGPSGCGKSTLLRLVTGLEKPSSGAVYIGEEPVRGPVTDLGVVFQDPILLEWRNVIDNVLLQLEIRGQKDSGGEKKAMSLLDSVGLGGFEEAFPRELSGGMRQRVSLCRALIHDPSLIVMDEPFSALDEITRQKMRMDLIEMWEKYRQTVLFITHSMAESILLADVVYVMSPRPGRIAHRLDVELPRPRTAEMQEEPEFVAYLKQLREVMENMGIWDRR